MTQVNQQDIIAGVDHLTLKDEAYSRWRKRAKVYTANDLFDDLLIIGCIIAFAAVLIMAAAHNIEAFKHNTTDAAANAAPLFIEMLLVMGLWRIRSAGKVRVAFILLVTTTSVLANLFTGLDYADNTALTDPGGVVWWQIFAIVAAFVIPFGTIFLGYEVPNLLSQRRRDERIKEQWVVDAYDELKAIFFAAYTKRGMSQRYAGHYAAQAANQFKPSVVTVDTSAAPQMAAALPQALAADMPTVERAIPVKSSGVSDAHQTDRQTPDRPDKAKGDKAEKARQHFRQYPADLKLDLRTAAAKIGVGKDTVSLVKKEFTRQ